MSSCKRFNKVNCGKEIFAEMPTVLLSREHISRMPVRIRLTTLTVKPTGDVTGSPKQGYQ